MSKQQSKQQQVLVLLAEEFGFDMTVKNASALVLGTVTELMKTVTNAVKQKMRLLRKLIKIGIGGSATFDKGISKLELVGQTFTNATVGLTSRTAFLLMRVFKYVTSSNLLLFTTVLATFGMLRNFCASSGVSLFQQWVTGVKTAVSYTLSMIRPFFPATMLSLTESALSTAYQSMATNATFAKLYRPFIGLTVMFCGTSKRVPNQIPRRFNLTRTQYYQAANAAYQTADLEKLVDGFEPVFQVPVLTAFVQKSTRTMLIACRGTIVETHDLVADFHIGVDGLEDSAHHRKVVKAMEEVIAGWPPVKYDYFITGHSLGGAEASALVRKYPFIRKGIVFNAALQAKDLVDETLGDKITRIHVEGDLIDSMNALSKLTAGVAEAKNTFRLKRSKRSNKSQSVLAYVTALAMNSTGAKQHMLDSFLETDLLSSTNAQE